MKTRQTRTFIMYGLMIALLVTSIAYAALQATLSISGTVTKKGGSWNIYFTNVSNPTLTGKAQMAKPSLDGTTNLLFSATLEQPLDKAEFTVDVVNDGTLDAALSSVLLTGISAAQAENVTYTVTYADGTEIKQYDALKKDQTKTLKITVMYDDVNEISSSDATLNLGLTLIYTQATESDIPSGEGSMGVVDASLASAPNLLNNSLTPVVYDETANNGAGSWVVADTTKQWYNYSNQEWANAVILNSGVTKNVGDTVLVPTEDSGPTEVKAMYVWIPRYEYKIEGTYGTHPDGTAGTAELPGEIEVNFIPSSQTTASSGYILHPAFQWDTNDDGSISAIENISGIWVGKFETSGNEITPTIIPNVDTPTVRAQSIEIKFTTAQKFGTYLSNSSNIDSHMMKNSEWGAVAYLSQSSYGKYGNSLYTGANKEIYLNPGYVNSSQYDSGEYNTGRSTGLIPAPVSSPRVTCPYNDIIDRGDGTGSCGGGASTTGNIYGVYDMSGGTYEQVMGYLTTANSNYASDPENYFGWSSSGSSNRSGFTYKPADKYFDAYTETTSATACNGGICYGHALSETSGWYKDTARFNETTAPWSARGGNLTVTAGIFNVSTDNGSGTTRIYGTRAVLLSTGA